MDNIAGQQIKGYELKERIAAGGFGAVYRAQQTTVGREVAVKVILPGLANQPDFIRRFEAEAQLIARLEHHFIVPLYDYWRDPDGAYLVMRYLRGGSLHDHIRNQGALSVEEAFNMFSQVAQGLHVAHRNRVIHRDIKPGNVLLDEDGTGFLADFGIAKDHATPQNITEPDSFVGSPEYLAPEQARSEPVTPQTDIYSMGVILYEMLTGEHPFPNLEKISIIFKHLNEPLPDIITLDDRICDDVNNVIQKATAKDPQQRFSDILEMVEALRQAAQLDSAPTPTSPVELLTPREQEVIQLIIDGKSNREIAGLLVLTEGTIKTYITRIYRKLNVRSRVQAIARLRDLNFVIQKPTDGISFSTGNLPEPENPYKGLHAFQAADAQDFFGREKLIEKLLSRLQEDGEFHRFLSVVGPSGSGKSSVVKAGLIPSLWRGELPGSENWYIVDLLPGAHPIDELEVALLQVASDLSLNLHEQLQRDQRGLVRVANLILPNDDSELLIVIDQFEEVFTLLENEEERLHFLDLISEAVTDKRSRVRVVVTLRADYYDRPLQYPEIGKLIRSRVETILPLGAEQLERAIVEPANRVGVTFEEGLVSLIVSDVHYQPGALPLFQYALTELFEHRKGHKLTLEAYQAIGGTGGALAKRAEEIFNEYDEQGQMLIQQMFLRLVTLGEGAEDTRRRAERSELLAIADDNQLMDEVVDLYVASRLLSLDNDPSTRQPTVEVAHEAILREWDRLRQWLNESREDIRQERVIAQAAQAWQNNKRDASYLLTGTRLEQAEQWQSATELSLTPLVIEFVQTSTQEAKSQADAEAVRQKHEKEQEEKAQQLTQRALRLFQGLVAIFVIATLVAGGLAAYSFNQSRIAADSKVEAELERDTQTSLLLAAMAADEIDNGNTERGVLVALEALEHYPFTPQAKSALVRSVDEYQPARTLEGVESIGWAVLDAQWSPDDTRIAGGGGIGAENSVIIWDATTGTELLSVNKSDDICSGRADKLSWSPEDDRIVHISFVDACGIVIWDSTNGETVRVLADYTSKATSIEWSSDGTTIISGHEDGTIILWDANSGTINLSLKAHDAQVNDIAWSPNGNFIATASADSTIHIWRTDNYTNHRVLDDHLGKIHTVAWSPDSTRIVTGGDDGLPRVWNVESDQPLFALLGHTSAILAIDWSADGYRIASLENGNVIIWDATTGTKLFDIKNPDRSFVDFSKDNTELITSQTNEYGRLAIRSVRMNALRLLGHTDDVLYANWSPDMTMFASVGKDETRIWDASTGQPLVILPITQSANAHGSWSPDSTRFVTAHQPPGVSGLPEEIYIWDSITGDSHILPLPEEIGTVTANWSPDGAYISSSLFGYGDPNPIYVWDADTYELLWTYEPDDPNCMQPWAEFSPDSSKIAAACFAFDDTGRNTSARILDVETGELLQKIEGNHGSIFHIIWSPDGKQLLVGYQGVAEIRDAVSGDVLQTFAAHGNARVWGVNWHPDGIHVVTGDASGVVKVWNSQTGEEIATYFVDAEVQSTQWSPDGTHIIIGGRMNEPIIKRVWLSTEDLIAHAYECCVTRELTPEERAQFGLPTE